MILGIVGGGQLGRMLGQAAIPLGVRCVFLEPADEPSAAVAGEVIRAAYDDFDALAALADRCDAVTYEFENVPVDTARWLEARVPLFPPPAALENAQDRLVEKRFFRDQGLETAAFAAVDDAASLAAAVEELGLPAILKTRRLGYDGKGQRFLAEPSDVEGAHEALGGVPCILEKVVPFDREVSVLAVRDAQGEVRTWPLVENHHEGGILRHTQAPAPEVAPELQALADDYAQRVTAALDYVGVIAIELFQVGDRLLANEFAPRVHNSGHFSIEGALTSQFENHVRAGLGLPLGVTDIVVPHGCANLIGVVPPLATLLAVPTARVHLYDKSERPGRKLGHVTVAGPDAETVRARLGLVTTARR
ncbi:MAG: 5-(carboxyamino)imidazole ribonucleotide synthase [Myxococcota bacterium]